MQRPVSTLNLDQALRTRLHNAGYRTTADLKDVAADSLAQQLKVSIDQAMSVLKQLKRDPLVSVSALTALTRERQRSFVTTSCKAFDEMLGGSGVPAGRVTEICGAPGMGKTQIGMQLCVNAQILSSQGGEHGEAIYIDTEGSFIVERVVEIAEATLKALNAGKDSQDSQTIEQFLSRIHVFRIHSYVEQVALINQLDDFLTEHPKVKVLIIDSIAFHFRQNFADMGLRTRLLNGMAQHLRRFAEEFDLAVVMMNQMTTRVTRGQGSDNDSSVLVPALGDSWGHACTNRIILCWQYEVRYASLVKSPNLQECTIPYAITSKGVRDVPGHRPATNPRKRLLPT
ncbi:RAD51-like protein c-like protein [Powellomyces hirtus]|nr:RAD51-like protein c-like protein [Powellomyces hirtus]